MEPIILKIYNSDVEREEEYQEIGNLFIKGKELPTGEVTYSIAYIPEGRSWNAYRDSVATYQNSMICMMDMKKKGFYLNSKDWLKFSRIADCEYSHIINSLKVEENTNKPVLCVTCGEDVGSGFFQIDNHDNYCITCYKKRFSCKDPEVIQKQEEEVNPQAAVGTCCKCHKIYPVNKMNLNSLNYGGWVCHNCFYEIEEGEDDAKV